MIKRSVRRVSRTLEIRCFHSRGPITHARGRGFSLYLCATCYDRLVRVIADSLAYVPGVPERDPLGIYCTRCDSRKLGSFVRIQSVEYRSVRRGASAVYSKPKITFQVFCKECWAEIWGSPRLIVKTKRSFYVPDEESGAFYAFFKGGIERTNQIYTLVKTEDLRTLVDRIPKKDRKALEEALTSVSRG